MDDYSRLPLNALRVLDALAQTGSLKRAAQRLHVQPSAVSMQLKGLAQYLGCPLLQRDGRGIRLTTQAKSLVPAVQQGLTTINEAVRALRRTQQHLPFRLAVLPSYLYACVLPALAEFERLHPEFQLQIQSSRALTDLAQGEADAAVRLGAGSWPGLHAEKLMDEFLLPVAAPALLARLQLTPAQAMAGLNTLPCLHNAIDPWSLWTAQLPARPSAAIDDSMVLLAQATEGKGLALARLALCKPMLDDGRLIALAAPIPYRYCYYWVYANPDAAQRGEPVLAWLRERSAEFMRDYRGHSHQTILPTH
jgi:LysR family transcriptional regulator, glycine cleavage system transcriptional activator